MTKFEQFKAIQKEYAEETNKMINCKIKSISRKIHKLKRKNLVLGDRRNVMFGKIIHYSKTGNGLATVLSETIKIVKISERIGNNGNKIQRLRTKISQLKKSLTPVVDE